jgi:hypothetical protein
MKTSKLKRMIVQCGNNCMIQRNDYKFVKIFESDAANMVLEGSEQ